MTMRAVDLEPATGTLIDAAGDPAALTAAVSRFKDADARLAAASAARALVTGDPNDLSQRGRVRRRDLEHGTAETRQANSRRS